MKFSRVIGKLDSKLVQQAQERLTSTFLEFALSGACSQGTGLGGDIFMFTLLQPINHVCTPNMPTAATDGKQYFWNPKFIIKQSKIGLRYIAYHEASHAIFMHPQRRGSRIPKLWNIAVDFIVNNMAMQDLKSRGKDPAAVFKKEVGDYITLEKYAEMLRDPFNVIEGLSDSCLDDSSSEDEVKLPRPDDDRELTEKEIREIEKRESKKKCYFADPELPQDMLRPENIYDYLYKLLPKCSTCGRVGIYKKPNKKSGGGDKSDKKSKNKDQSGNGQNGNKPCPNGCGEPCPECGDGEDGFDIFGFGSTLDDHLDTEESEEKLAKRLADAVYAARKMAGHIPAGMEDELGLLTAPKITWKDTIRSRILRSRSGNGRNDWTKFRTRPMSCGMLVPKKRHYFTRFGCLLDTSGSMSSDDMSFGVSQLQSLDDKSEGVLVSCDAEVYWNDAVELKKCNAEELTRKVRPIGRGGTQLGSFFSEYEKKIGKCDFLIIITDSFLMDQDIADMKNPGIPVYWLVTSGAIFEAPFGKVMNLR